MKKTLALMLLLAGLTLEARAETLTWTGEANNEWNDWDKNWKNESGAPTVYQDGDDVVFADCSCTLVQSFGNSPASVLVKNSEGCDYTIDIVVGATSALGGTMSLTKEGDGDLSLRCSNPYTGNTYIHGGIVVVYDAGALGSGTVYLHGGGLEIFSREGLVNNVIVDGNAHMCGDVGGTLTLNEKSTLTLTNSLCVSGGDLLLKDGATLDFDKHEVCVLPGTAKVSGNASIGNGEISNFMLNVEAGKTLTLLANTSATYGTVFNLGEGATLNLGGNSVNFADASISASGDSAGIGHGTITGNLTVAAGKQITLLAGTSITGGVTLGDDATFNLGENTITGAAFTFDGSGHTIGNGVIEGGLTVAEGQTLRLCGDLTGSGSIDLGQKAVLDLGGYTLGKDVTLTSAATKATLGNGTLDSNVYVQGDKTLWLGGNLSGKGTILLNGGSLNLNWKTLSTSVKAENGSRIGYGKFNGTLTVADKATLTISGKMDGSGTIILGEGALLYLEETLDNNVTLNGSSAYMGGLNYAFRGNLYLGAGKTLTLSSDLQGGTGGITLGEGGTLDLGGHTLSDKSVYVTGNNATIRNGVFSGHLDVAKNVTLTLPKEGLTLSNPVKLNDNATLNLGGGTLSTSITLNGSSTSIGNGAITSDLNVLEGKTLKLSGNLDGTGTVKLDNNATLDLGNHALSNTVAMSGNTAYIGNGSLNGGLTVDSDKTLKLSDNLTGTGTIALKANATLDLGGHTLASSLSEKLDLNADPTKGPAIIGNGTIEGTIHVPLGKKLTLLPGTSVTERIMLDGNAAKLDLGGNTFKLDGSKPGNLIAFNNEHASMSLVVSNGTLEISTNCALRQLRLDMHSGTTLNLQGRMFTCDKVVASGNVSLGNGTLFGVVEITEDSKLTLCGYLAGVSQGASQGAAYIGTDNVTVANNATLDLNENEINKYLVLSGNVTTVGNGTIVGDMLTLLADHKLTLLANTSITGEISLNNNSTLDLGGNTFHIGGAAGNKITLDNDISGISIGNGTLDGTLEMKEGQTLTLCGNLKGSGAISMATGSTLNLGSHTLSKDVTLTGSATVTAGHTTIKALKEDKEGLLQGLSVSDGLIAGTDKQSSLADGLEISRMGYDLTLENLVLTANNKISVGNGHTITLNNVTIKISADVCQLVNGIYTIDLKNLINCDLAMQNVLLDASNLTLPEGFDLAKDAVAFDFGDDVSIQKATGLNMRVGNYWSPSLNLDEQGKVIFTKLVETPEPTTGTLSLLALAALAARRRRKK